MVVKMILQHISGAFRILTKLSFYASLIVMVLVLVPGFPPYISFKSFKVAPAIKLDGPLAPNYALDLATVFLEGDVTGASSIAIKGNLLYTGGKGGRVLRLEDKVNGKELINIAQIGKPCKSPEDHVCGLPLGVRADSERNVIIADARYGIVKVNLWSGDVQYYFSMESSIDGKSPKHPNDLDVAKDGTVYWSDFSTEYKFDNQLALERIGDNSGRLLRFDPATKKNTVLLPGLFGANGVQLSPKEDFVLITEFYKYRVLRYYLKGPKAGTSDVFVEGLPGAPDNIRPNGRGGYYVALLMPRVPMFNCNCSVDQSVNSTFIQSEVLGQLPQLRKLLFRIRWFVLTTLAIYDKLKINNSYLDFIEDYAENFGDLGFVPDGKSSIVEVDGEGQIIQVLKTNKSDMHGISQITVGEKYAYMGGPDINKIWKINITHLQDQ